jgi:nucleoside-diphosphate-sugar epimerase
LAYALAVGWVELPGALVVARIAAWLLIGLAQGELLSASETPVLARFTRTILPMEADAEALLTGAPEPKNDWCAIAKITGIKLCEVLRRQYNIHAISLMPTNLYGFGDNYHFTNSHVLPALIRRFHEAAEAQAPSVTRWGKGTPLREFLHVDDLGEA